ncbi:hypothetical protein KIW84_040626 [Lathyrus oleraceus]|uniref:Uncharacterized protein n=1 Tax=Pisum sativum TaxID=3888 RepID=A0A9D5AR24_PEA|nr:hypothetical protein KIW84_040626 [Pisum sativum]
MRLISSTQLSFLLNRNMKDEVLVINEIMEFAVNVNFKKAYGCVSWVFFRCMMVKTGFEVRWRGWMKALIFNSFVSVLANGSPTEDFAISRGHLSPFLSSWWQKGYRL